MIEDLIKAKKISQEHYDVYMLYQTTELGRKCLSNMANAEFRQEIPPHEFKGVGFAFYDGRRSVWRDIFTIIDKVQDLIRENLNDGGS